MKKNKKFLTLRLWESILTAIISGTVSNPHLEPILLNSSPSKTTVCKMCAWSEVVTLQQYSPLINDNLNEWQFDNMKKAKM